MSGTVSTSDPLIHGILSEVKEGMIVLALPGKDYRIHLAIDHAPAAHVGQRIAGQITARAKRIDVVSTGGRFIDPVIGRPRRLQGRITAIDTVANTITVFCGAPLTCTPTMNQKAADFHMGDLVAFDIERGAKIEISADHAH